MKKKGNKVKVKNYGRKIHDVSKAVKRGYTEALRRVQGNTNVQRALDDK